MLILLHMVKILWDHTQNHTLLIRGGSHFLPFFLILLDHLDSFISLKQIQLISSPKASNGQRFPCPALFSPWFSRGAWLAGSEGWLAGSEACLAGSEACLAGSKACLAGSWALEEGD